MFENLGKKLHDAVMSDDGEDDKPKPATPPAKTGIDLHNVPMKKLNFADLQQPSASAGGGTGAGTAVGASSPFTVPGTTVLDEAVYQRVLDKTNFDKTSAGQ